MADETKVTKATKADYAWCPSCGEGAGRWIPRELLTADMVDDMWDDEPAGGKVAAQRCPKGHTVQDDKPAAGGAA
jgi:hypothetical protein